MSLFIRSNEERYEDGYDEGYGTSGIFGTHRSREAAEFFKRGKRDGHDDLMSEVDSSLDEDYEDDDDDWDFND